MSVTAGLPTTQTIARMQAAATRAAGNMAASTREAAEREARRVAEQSFADQRAARRDFEQLSRRGEAAAWGAAMQAVDQNLRLFPQASAQALTAATTAARGLQDHVDQSFFGTIDALYGGTDWRENILGASAGVVDDATAMADMYREVMPDILRRAHDFTATTMGNLQRMAEGVLSEGAMNALNRHAGEVMNQMGRAGQAALYSRAAMIGQTTEEAQAQAIQLMPGALGTLQQAYGQSMEILGRPGEAAAQYTDTMMRYMPGQVDPTGLYSQGLQTLMAAGVIDQNQVFGQTLSARNQLASQQLSNLASIRDRAAAGQHSAWSTGLQQSSSDYFNRLEAGIAMAGDQMRHSFDMAGIRLAEQTAGNQFVLGQRAILANALGQRPGPHSAPMPTPMRHEDPFSYQKRVDRWLRAVEHSRSLQADWDAAWRNL